MKTILLAAATFFALSGAMPTYHQYKPSTVQHNAKRDASLVDYFHRRQPAPQPATSFLDVPKKRSLGEIVHNVERAPAPLVTLRPREEKPREYQPNEKRAPRYRPHKVVAKRQDVPSNLVVEDGKVVRDVLSTDSVTSTEGHLAAKRQEIPAIDFAPVLNGRMVVAREALSTEDVAPTKDGDVPEIPSL